MTHGKVAAATAAEEGEGEGEGLGQIGNEGRRWKEVEGGGPCI